MRTKAKTLLSQNVIMAPDVEKKFREYYLGFSMTVVQYLQSSVLAVKITWVLNNNNCCYKMFGVRNASTDSIVDEVRSQWLFLQIEDIKNEWYQLDENKNNSSTSGKKDSYCARAEELCGFTCTPVKLNMKRINDFWEKIDSLRDEE